MKNFPPPSIFRPGPFAGRSAFTLIEMLVVISIIVVMTAILIPASRGVMRSYQLNTVSQTVMGQLNMARQSALTRGHAVQVRLYYLPDYNLPASAAPAVFRALQCFVEGDPTTAGTPLTPLGKAAFFTSPVMILDDNTRSSLLKLVQATPVATEKLPPYDLNYKYISFRFKPNGKTDLVDTSTGITLVLKGDPIVTNGLPKNYRVIEVDPRSGSIRNYQP